MSETPTITSRIKGSILGVAVTDALGGPAEFLKRGTFPKVESMIRNEHFHLPPGFWTDDTSMTLCLAQSLIDCKGSSLADQIRKYLRWYDHGYLSSTDYCFDIGGATRTALNIWDQILDRNLETTDVVSSQALQDGQEEVDKLLKKETVCGNGSLMRTAPIGLFFSKDIDLASRVAVASSDVTHPYPTNSEACVFYTRLIVRAMQGASKPELLAELASFRFKELKARFEKHQLPGSFAKLKEENVSSSGYVVNSLEASLWAFFTTQTFRDGAIKVVNLGDDADTVGAIYGGLAGAFYGLEAIPSDWLDALQKRDVVEGIANELAVVGAQLSRPD